jgi:uncharacterized membrane protein required for colicin V production
MLLTILTILVTLAVGYAYMREGLFTAFCMCCNVIIAGLVAFNFWEPLAELLESTLSSTPLHGYEDVLCLLTLFCITLAGLRTVTNVLANAQISLPPALQRGGGVVFGMLTGYLATGFLLCAFQTMPWHENFMFFDPTYDSSNMLRRVLPPDRVWLGMMYRAGAFAFSNQEDPNGQDDSYYERFYTFDKSGTFEYRYAKYRRYGDTREPLEYRHEFDRDLQGPQ